MHERLVDLLAPFASAKLHPCKRQPKIAKAYHQLLIQRAGRQPILIESEEPQRKGRAHKRERLQSKQTISAKMCVAYHGSDRPGEAHSDHLRYPAPATNKFETLRPYQTHTGGPWNLPGSQLICELFFRCGKRGSPEVRKRYASEPQSRKTLVSCHYPAQDDGDEKHGLGFRV